MDVSIRSRNVECNMKKYRNFHHDLTKVALFGKKESF